MAKKKESDDSVIVTAAKAIGEAAGKVAVLTGVAAPAPPAKPKIGKLKPKNKARLPRKEKKAQKKKAAAAR